MKNLFYIPVFIIFGSLVSCESKSDNKEQTTESTATNTVPVSSATTNENTNSNNATLPALSNTSQVTLNPEHGKPGHRCDISVGAPLTGAPANNTIQTITTPNSSANNAGIKPTTAPAIAVAPGMNPQHGQPGHRCDIAVGAPLDSKPKQ
jgi:hypothetical protein